MGALKHLQIFRPGRQTSKAGEAIAFSESDLAACAEAYDPALHEAPIVVGHPQDGAPAYGWIQSLSYADAHLNAVPHQVDASFAELVGAGRYKKISASFYRPTSPSNPVPGVWYLRHVGFLGAQPPALKGLRDASFAGTGEDFVEFADWDDVRIAGLFRGLRDWLISKFGLDEANQALPEDAVSGAQLSAALSDPDPVPDSGTSSYAEGNMKPEEIAAREAALQARETKLAADEASFAERSRQLGAQELAARRLTHLDFAESLVKAGRLLPAYRDGLVSFMADIGAADVVEFGEGDAKKSEPALAWFKELLDKHLAQQVAFGEHARHTAGVDLDDPNALAAAAVEFQEAEAKAGRPIDIATAVAHISSQRG